MPKNDRLRKSKNQKAKKKFFNIFQIQIISLICILKINIIKILSHQYFSS